MTSRRSAAILAALTILAAAPSWGETPPENQLQQRIIAVSDKVRPWVVHIEAIVKVNDRRSIVTGSGVVASADGYLLTNQHVVDKAQKVTVTVPGRKQKYPAEVIGTDTQTDIAVLKVTPDTPLPAAEFGRNSDVQVGQWVLAVGNPYGLDGTVSFGIVSAKGRNLEIPNLLNDFVQTDAMIDRGSSGGPLVDLQGRVIGINSRGQGRGIGFTIPVETALEVMRQLQKGGIERGWLGVTVQPLDRDLAAYLEIPDTTGVVVNSVTAGSPAARAGIETGDVVTSFAGARIEAEEEEDLGAFQRQVARLEPGQRAQVEVLREGKPRRLEIEIGAQPKIQPDEVESDFGFQVQEITQDLFREQRLGVREGAYVFFVAGGSPAAEAGLLPGDVIQSVDRKSVETLQDFERVMDALGGKERVLVTARRGDETKFLLLKKGAKPAGPSSSEDDAGEAAEKHPREEGKPSQP